MDVPPADGVGRFLSFGTLTATLAAIGTVWILFLMAIIVADVIGRAFFDAPILGVAEAARFSIVAIVFLQLPQTLRGGNLTRAELMIDRLKAGTPRLAAAFELVFNLIGAAMFAVIVWTTWPLMMESFANNDFYGSTGVVEIPTGPLKLIIMLGAAVMILQFLLFAWRDLRGILGRAA
jgi:TRAP-type C4-dicarboxylate transport system permease small subunit